MVTSTFSSHVTVSQIPSVWSGVVRCGQVAAAASPHCSPGPLWWSLVTAALRARDGWTLQQTQSLLQLNHRLIYDFWENW